MALPINVFMSVYNNAEFFPHALDSILAWDDCSKILLMEGSWNPSKPPRSTDGTVELIQSYEAQGVPTIWWKNMSLDEYPCWMGDRHRELMEEAPKHPYWHGPTFQQLLLSRSMAMSLFRDWHKGTDPGWFFLVDSDEVYSDDDLRKLAEFIDVVGDDYDFFTVRGLNFYFSGNYFRPEWYRRIFRIKPTSFFGDDNSVDSNEGLYTRTMNIPIEIAQFNHYCYIGQKRVDKKLEMWNPDAVEKWMARFGGMLRGEVPYDGSNVHLFGHINPAYADYKLFPYRGTHPKGIGRPCDKCNRDQACEYCGGTGVILGCYAKV